jgi:hypothetical protein
MRYWKDILFEMWRHIKCQYGDLYDEEFELMIKYIDYLENENATDHVEFKTKEWDSPIKFLNDACKHVYYVSRVDMQKEVDDVIAMITDADKLLMVEYKKSKE